MFFVVDFFISIVIVISLCLSHEKAENKDVIIW